MSTIREEWIFNWASLANGSVLRDTQWILHRFNDCSAGRRNSVLTTLGFRCLISMWSCENKIDIIGRPINAFSKLLLLHLTGLWGCTCTIILTFLSQSIIELLFFDFLHFPLIWWMEIRNLRSQWFFNHCTMRLQSTYLAGWFDAPNLIVGYHVFPCFALSILEKTIMRLMDWIHKFVWILNTSSIYLFDIIIPGGKCLLLKLLIHCLKLSSGWVHLLHLIIRVMELWIKMCSLYLVAAWNIKFDSSLSLTALCGR